MQKTKKSAIAAIMTAVATVLAVLSMFIPLQLPFGGSVTFVCMLPIILVSYMFGIKWGLGSAFVFAIIQTLLGGKTVMAFFMPGSEQMLWYKAVIVCLLDYILAYTVIGFGGIFAKKIKSPSIAISLGSIFALTLRYIIHTISGAIFFGIWAEWFFSEAGKIGEFVLSHISGAALAIVYSICYNGAYMIPEIILTAVAAYFLPKFLKEYIRIER